MIKRRILACLVALCLVVSLSGLPALADTDTANTVNETTQAVSQADQPVSSSQVQADSPDAQQTYSTEPVGDLEPVNEPVNDVDRYYDSSEYIPAPHSGQRSSLIPQCNDPVQVKVDQDVNVIVDSQAKAITGQGDSAGTHVNNTVGGTSQAFAVGGSGEPVAPSLDGAFAQNDVTKLMGNSGTANATTGLAKANNTMNDNAAKISPDVTVSVGGFGNIDDTSNVAVNASLYYLAVIAGVANARSGNSAALGLNGDNSINSTDDAFAKGDSALSLTGGIYDGSALANNGSDNSIASTGTALAASGKANAGNDMQENDITIAPVVKAIINICGDIVGSNITVNLVYKFVAIITGMASATSGESAAVGANVDNNIDNSTNAKAVGDAPAPSILGSDSYSDGSAVAGNDTSNVIENNGQAVGVSGDAAAMNMMKDNDIFISPIITSEIDLLDNMVGSNLTINITYNFWAQILGKANSKTGDADALGLAADNSIANTSSATAIGDSAKPSLLNGGGQADGEAMALNDTSNFIKNNGSATSGSGNSSSLNTMADNVINLSPVLTTVAMVVKPLTDGSVIIDIVYDIWANLTGSSDATAGNATSAGSVSVNTIGSKSNAVAIADVSLNKPDGQATASNSSDNQIGNDGQAVAFSGNTCAQSTMKDALIAVTGCLQEDIVADGSQPTIERANAIKAKAVEVAEAHTGDARSLGATTLNVMTSNAVSKDIFGKDTITVNDHDDDILNKGQAEAVTGDAVAKTGSAAPNNTDNVIMIGFNPANECPTGDCDTGENGPQLADSVNSADQNGANSPDSFSDSSTGIPSGTDTTGGSGGSGSNPTLDTGHADSIAYAAYSTSGYRPVGMPLWLWAIVFGLFAGWIRLSLIVKPWKLFRKS